MLGSVVALAVLAAGQPPADKGWDLKIESPRLAGPVFVGEWGSQIAVTVTLTNLTAKDREYVALPRAVRLLVLDGRVTGPDGSVLGLPCRAAQGEDFRTLTPLAAGKSASQEVRLSGFLSGNFRTPGKHSLRLTYTTPDGRATSNAIGFEVVDPVKDDLLARHAVPVVGGEADQPAGRRSAVFIDQVTVGGKTYLLYRRYAGPLHGGGLASAALLAELPGKVELQVVGGYGDRPDSQWDPFFVVYRQAANGATVLRVPALGGRAEERLVSEGGSGLDDGPDTVPFEGCTFTRAQDVPPEKLRLAYAGFVAAVKTGDVAKFCLPHAVEVSDKEDPKRGDTAPGMNVPWMKAHFREKVVSCRRDGDDGFLIRTASSYLHWVQTRSGEWRIYRYGDKPVE